MEDISRRRFLQGAGAVGATVLGAGCSGDGEDSTPTDTATDSPTGTPEEETPGQTTEEEETSTEEEEEREEEENIDRPANYRWDMKPGRNEELRNELSQYISGSVGEVVQDHPAFDHATDSERDDHEIDFEALKLYRDSNFDIMDADPDTGAMEEAVQAFVDDSMYEEAKTSAFIRHDLDSPSNYDSEAWLNADTVADSLDLGHNLLISMNGNGIDLSPAAKAATIREAYDRHHDFDVLAWQVPMRDGVRRSGMMYSPDDDKVRTFNVGGQWLGEESRQFHSEIQDWNVINNEGGAAGSPEDFHHPVLFHTDEWDREGISFEDAKDQAVEMVYSIATDTYNGFNSDALEMNDAPVDNITMTTGATEQLTRTLLDYNKSGVDANFSDIRDLANFAVGKYLQNDELNGIIDTVEPGDDSYDEYFGGGFAFYEVEDEEIVDEVKTDQSHDYDNFGEVYDQLEAV